MKVKMTCTYVVTLKLDTDEWPDTFAATKGDEDIFWRGEADPTYFDQVRDAFENLLSDGELTDVIMDELAIDSPRDLKVEKADA